MMELGSLALLSAASLAVAGLHVAHNSIFGNMRRTAWLAVTAQREEIRLARLRQTEAEQKVSSARQRLEDLQNIATELERNSDHEIEDKLRFEVVIGRSAPGLSSYRGRVERRTSQGSSRDAIVWCHPVFALVWANSLERAGAILAEVYPHTRGYVTGMDAPWPERVPSAPNAAHPEAG